MERAERIGLGVALAGHVALLVLLSLSLSLAKIPKSQLSDPMDVQFVDKVGLTSAAPKVSQEAPAPSVAPEKGAPEDSNPPPPKAEPVPEPKPQPKPVPPRPTPAPPKPQPKPEPKPEPKPVPKPTPAKPDKAKPEKQQAKPAPAKAKPAPAKPEKKSGLSSDFLKDLPQDKPGNAKPKGSRLGADFLKGLSPSKAPGKASAPRAAAISAQSMSGLIALIAAKVKPCYNPPAGGADSGQIVTLLSIRMNKDGSVASVTPGAQSGVNGSNSAYARQMADAAVRAVRRCSPITGLPPELYDGGWSDFDFRFRPDQMQ
ncbi:cell envelope biogenesis protein TolA [Sphingomonas oryzagri]|jgi:outer membrane biosynthesis protein TonB|uniref:Cell envelope biogenesis protein TolA n=1 Tax=Sphingomonas oryzagri TaxID=3042314 RepID=A0ABT6N7G0_9SPHN|nr:cell envelope biogenesis protein TolA [Sphingomonas oryzagri]MDH7641051.1 cell envelope biogenesis protein TolA [Sphingomonas oryzagri]